MFNTMDATVKKVTLDVGSVWTANLTTDWVATVSPERIGVLVQIVVGIVTVVYLYYQIVKVRKQIKQNPWKNTDTHAITEPVNLGD